MFFLKLTLLKIKRMLRFLPGIVAGALALCFVGAVFAFGAKSLIYKDRQAEKQTIGIVCEVEDKYVDIALGMVKNMDSVKEICDFVIFEGGEQAAADAIERQELDGAVILPKDFISGIVHGKNVPARVILPSGSGLYTSVFKCLADDGIGMLADVQAAVQGAAYSTEAELDFRELDMVYLDIFLPREKLFRENRVLPSDSLTMGEYYGVMAGTVVMLLWGMCLAFAIGGEDKNMRSALKIRGTGRCSLFLADSLTVFCFYAMATAAILGIVSASGIDIKCHVGGAVLYVLLMSAAVSCIYALFPGKSGALVLFALTLLWAFVGGALLPAAFLPVKIAEMGKYSPIRVLYELGANLFADKFTFNSFKLYIIMTAGFYGVGLLGCKIRECAEK